MSTGKRLAKRSVVGTRVAACGSDGFYRAGVICGARVIEGRRAPVYSVRLEGSRQPAADMDPAHIVGPGFGQVSALRLPVGQRVFVTHNGREVEATVSGHVAGSGSGGGGEDVLVDVTLDVTAGADTVTSGLRRRADEVRLWASRKSPRLLDSDTDFARLADCGTDKRHRSPTIDVPPAGVASAINNNNNNNNSIGSGRKRRPSLCVAQLELGEMNECTAAMVLMSLSAAPKSPRLSTTSGSWSDRMSEVSSASSEAFSESAGQTSSASVDEGIDDMDDDSDDRRPRERTYVVFKCTWPKCRMVTSTCSAIERHVRSAHLGPANSDQDSDMSDHEEEFYYTELEVTASQTAGRQHQPSQQSVLSLAEVGAMGGDCAGGSTVAPIYQSATPTLSHMDMARPPHEDPQYIGAAMLTGYQPRGALAPAAPGQSLLLRNNQLSAGHIGGAGVAIRNSYEPTNYQQKYIRLGPKAFTTPHKLTTTTRRPRGDVKKCRKVYGMEHREQWCTQCKWKKACTRFSESV